MAKRTVADLLFPYSYIPQELKDAARLPVVWDTAAPTQDVAHFAFSKVCPTAKSLPPHYSIYNFTTNPSVQYTTAKRSSGGLPGPRAEAPEYDKFGNPVLTPLPSYLNYHHLGRALSPASTCKVCFTGAGCTDVIRWARSPTAPPALQLLALLSDIHTLKQKASRTRTGLIRGTAYGTKGLPTVVTAITKINTRIARLTDVQLHQIAEQLTSYTEVVECLRALTTPGVNDYIMSRLKRLITGAQPNLRLNATPTLMAINMTNVPVHGWNAYSHELVSSLRISPPQSTGTVFYGPRYAIDYLIRSMLPYTAASLHTVQVDDPELARIAAGLWTPHQPNGLSDIYDALDAAQTLTQSGTGYTATLIQADDPVN